MVKRIDMAGKRYGRLIVLQTAGQRVFPCGRTALLWLCRCDCGKQTTVSGEKIRKGHTKSCGCLSQYMLAEGLISRKHGFARPKKGVAPEYKVWISLSKRCYDPKDKGYHRYGARGITVCSKWRNDFIAFYADMGARPSPDHSIDRIDNDGNYGYLRPSVVLRT